MIETYEFIRIKSQLITLIQEIEDGVEANRNESIQLKLEFIKASVKRLKLGLEE